MICCKIITNYDNPNGLFSSLYDTLRLKGKVLWASNHLYFSSSDNITDEDIANIIKENGYGNCYVYIYNNDNLPKEDDFINGWITDCLIKNNYEGFLKANEKSLKKQSKDLDKLNKELDNCLLKIKKEAQIDKEDKVDDNKAN